MPSTRTPWNHVRRASWSIMSRLDIKPRDHQAEHYITRWRIVRTPAFGVLLHRISSPDLPVYHDHPWDFVTITLVGCYSENRPGRTLNRRRIRFRRGESPHYIAELHSPVVWSLLLVGRRRREWGYITEADGGYRWTHWKSWEER